LLALAVGLSQPLLASGGSTQPRSQPAEEEPVLTPEQEAVEHYNSGIALRDRAWKMQEKMEASTTDKDREKLAKKITGSYRRALREFQSAVDKNDGMFQAHSEIGYCLRKLGDYDASLAAYNRALGIEPRYAEAIEYRGETFLALNRIDDAKHAYMELFGGARAHADKLLEAMDQWLAQRSASGDVDSGTVEAFAGWVAERQEIAGQTKSVSQLKTHDW